MHGDLGRQQTTLGFTCDCQCFHRSFLELDLQRKLFLIFYQGLGLFSHCHNLFLALFIHFNFTFILSDLPRFVTSFQYDLFVLS